MTPDTLAAIVARDALATDDWLPKRMPLYLRAAFEDRRALLALLRETREALANLMSYPGPVRMTEASHETCSPDECYVTAARAALAALDLEPPA